MPTYCDKNSTGSHFLVIQGSCTHLWWDHMCLSSPDMDKDQQKSLLRFSSSEQVQIEMAKQTHDALSSSWQHVTLSGKVLLRLWVPNKKAYIQSWTLLYVRLRLLFWNSKGSSFIAVELVLVKTTFELLVLSDRKANLCFLAGYRLINPVTQ